MSRMMMVVVMMMVAVGRVECGSLPLSFLSLTLNANYLESLQLSITSPIPPITRRLHRQDAVSAWDAHNNRVLVFGGTTDDLILDDTWELDLDTLEWNELNVQSGNVRPPARFSLVGGIDQVSGLFLVIGGESLGFTFPEDLWIFDTTKPANVATWKSIPQARRPSGRYGLAGGVNTQWISERTIPIGSPDFGTRSPLVVSFPDGSSTIRNIPSRAIGSTRRTSDLDGSPASFLFLTHGFGAKTRYNDGFTIDIGQIERSMLLTAPQPISTDDAAFATSFFANPDSLDRGAKSPFNRCLLSGAVGSVGTMNIWGGCGSLGFGPCPAHDTHVWQPQPSIPAAGSSSIQSQAALLLAPKNASNYDPSIGEWNEVSKCASPKLFSASSIYPFSPSKLSSDSIQFREASILIGGSGRNIWPTGVRGEVGALDLLSGSWRRLRAKGLQYWSDRQGSVTFTPDALPPSKISHHTMITITRPPTWMVNLFRNITEAPSSTNDFESSTVILLMGGDLGQDMWLLGGDLNHRENELLPCPFVFNIRLFHALMMFLSWSVFIPIGILLARYGRDPGAGALNEPAPDWLLCKCRRPSSHPEQDSPAVAGQVVEPAANPNLWFVLHRLIQMFGLFLMCGGFIAAILMVPIHAFKLDHHFIGVIVVAIGLTQPLNAFCRPHPPQPNTVKSRRRRIWELIHHWSGRIAVLLAWANSFLGLRYIHAPIGYTGGLAAWYGAQIVIGIFAEVRRRRLELEKQTESLEAGPTEIQHPMAALKASNVKSREDVELTLHELAPLTAIKDQQPSTVKVHI